MNKILKYLLSPYVDVNQKSSTKGNKLYILDGIRGLAVLIVILSHSNALLMRGQGSLGVFLFFFLSGIVLTIPYSDFQKTLSKSEVYVFFLNRIFRILPLYVVMVGIYTIVFNNNIEWFFWNISFIKGWNHFWSVAEEIRFYLLFPIIILILSLIKNRYIRLILLSILIYICFKHFRSYKIDMMDGRMVSFYFFIFLGGIFTYLVTILPNIKTIVNNNILNKFFNTVAIIIFLMFFLTSMDMVDNYWQIIFTQLPDNYVINGWRRPGLWFLLFIIFFFSLLTFKNGIIYRILINYFFRHIGLLSYSLYLSHIFVIKYLRGYGFEKEMLFFVTFLISYLIALLTYVLIEKPFLILKKNIAIKLIA